MSHYLPTFTLHESDFGGGGVIAISIHRSFSLGSALQFTIVERSSLGSVCVHDRAGDDAELVHIAPHRAAAEEWLSLHCYATLIEVEGEESLQLIWSRPNRD